MSIVRRIKLLLDKASAQKTERQLKASAKRQEEAQKRAWGRVKQAILGAFAVRTVARFTREMFTLGSAAAETASKFRTVFGSEQAAQLDVFLGKFGKLAGLTRTEGRDMLAIAGAIGQGLGLASAESAVFSQRIVELAGDMQSFHDVPIEETFAAIRSGITGETEPLKRLGIVLRAVDVDRQALLETGKASTKELTEAEKATARLNLIYEKAGVALGDLERTKDSDANTMRRLVQIYRQFKEDLAGGLLPVFSLVINAWAAISDGAEGATDVIAGISRKLTDFVGGIQLMAVELNAFFRSLPARIQLMTAKVNDFIVVGMLNPLEDVINVFRRLMRMDEIDITSNFAAANEEFRKTALADLAAWRALVEEETAAIVKASEIVADAIVPAPDAEGPDPAIVAEEEAAARKAQLRREEQAIAAQEFAAQELLSAQIQKASADAKEAEEERLKGLQERAKEAGAAMSGALRSFLSISKSSLEGAGSVWAVAAKAARGAGAAIVAGLVEGRAAEQTAQGVAKLAAGTWPPNPAALIAAGRHFAAAALFKAIPGVIAGGGGGASMGGGGGAAATLPPGGIGSSLASTDGPIENVVNIFMDPLSPSNPDFQRVALGAVQNAQERFGANVKVNVRPRTQGGGAG